MQLTPRRRKEPTVGRRIRNTLQRAAALGLVAVTTVVAVPAAASSITITNGSSRALDGVYLTATAQSAWGDDLLDGGLIAPGDVWTTTASCQGVVVVVAEDVAGCFLSQSVACGADAAWTITGSTPRDCGH
jgi:hypothetical protein